MQLPKEGATASPRAQRAAPPTAEALLAFVQSLYGPLSEAELSEVSGVIGAVAKALATIDAFPLDNADEPMPVFAAYRAD